MKVIGFHHFALALCFAGRIVADDSDHERFSISRGEMKTQANEIPFSHQKNLMEPTLDMEENIKKDLVEEKESSLENKNDKEKPIDTLVASSTGHQSIPKNEEVQISADGKVINDVKKDPSSSPLSFWRNVVGGHGRKDDSKKVGFASKHPNTKSQLSFQESPAEPHASEEKDFSSDDLLPEDPTELVETRTNYIRGRKMGFEEKKQVQGRLLGTLDDVSAGAEHVLNMDHVHTFGGDLFAVHRNESHYTCDLAGSSSSIHPSTTYSWTLNGRCHGTSLINSNQKTSKLIVDTDATPSLCVAEFCVTNDLDGTVCDRTQIVLTRPSAGYVIGHGAINSTADTFARAPYEEGEVHFYFNPLYSGTVLGGPGSFQFIYKNRTQFVFQVDTYDWMVFHSPKCVTFKGQGTLYRFGVKPRNPPYTVRARACSRGLGDHLDLQVFRTSDGMQFYDTEGLHSSSSRRMGLFLSSGYIEIVETTASPTPLPTQAPTIPLPTASPTMSPTVSPTVSPTASPTTASPTSSVTPVCTNTNTNGTKDLGCTDTAPLCRDSSGNDIAEGSGGDECYGCGTLSQLAMCISLDNSYSVNAAEWAIMTNFAINMVQNLTSVHDYSRFAVVKYGNEAVLDSNWTDAAATVLVIDSLAEFSGIQYTNVEAGFLECHAALQNAPASLTKVLLMIADGNPTAYYSAPGVVTKLSAGSPAMNAAADAAADAVKSDGIKIISVSITAAVDQSEAQGWATSPDMAFHAADFVDLNSLVDGIDSVQAFCEG